VENVAEVNDAIRRSVAAYCNAGRFNDAEELLRKTFGDAVSQEQQIASLLLLSDVYDRAGDFEEACKALFAAIEIDKRCVPAWNNLGVLCRRAGKDDAARDAFVQALEIDPEHADVLTNLGAAELKAGDAAGAKACLERALAADPSHAAAHANLALTLALFGRIEEAEEELRLAVFHGYDQGELVQHRLDRMKEVRAEILARSAGDQAAPGTEMENGG
jgi:Tfp pilus assembly protein PilF